MPEPPIVIGSNAIAAEREAPPEEALGTEATALIAVAKETSIQTQADYEQAAAVLRNLKQLQGKVKDYWEPLRKSAKAAYDSVLEKKKEMLTPLEDAEKALKDQMTVYTVQQEEKRKAQEEEMRQAARRESDLKLEEAAAAEQSGDTAGAAAAMEEAEVLDGMASSARVTARAPKANGVSQTKTWKLKSVDPEKVPIKVGGVEIRPVDQAAVMRLIRESKGTISIPGVEYEESVQISVRA